jgi:hypothetical protein
MLRVNVAIAAGLAAFVMSAAPAAACAERAERIQAAVTSDVRTRNIAAAVGERLLGELRQAAEHCRAGRAAQGDAIVRRIVSTYGYRVP